MSHHATRPSTCHHAPDQRTCVCGRLASSRLASVVMRNEHNGFSIRAIRLLTLPHSRSVTTLPRVSALCATWREHALLLPRPCVWCLVHSIVWSECARASVERVVETSITTCPNVAQSISRQPLRHQYLVATQCMHGCAPLSLIDRVWFERRQNPLLSFFCPTQSRGCVSCPATQGWT